MNLLKKEDNLYCILTTPLYLEWAKMLYIKCQQSKGVKIYTKSGKYLKSFQKNLTQENIMPFLRTIMSTFEPNSKQNYQWQIENLDRAINPRKYKDFKGLPVFFHYGGDSSWLKNLKEYFNIQHDVYYRKRKLYIRIDEYKPSCIYKLFNIKL